MELLFLIKYESIHSFKTTESHLQILICQIFLCLDKSYIVIYLLPVLLFPVLLSNLQGHVPTMTCFYFSSSSLDLINITAFYNYSLHFLVFDYSSFH